MHSKFKFTIAFIWLLFFNSNIYAGCDICSLYLGIHPNQSRNNISLKYRYSLYSSAKGHDHGGGNHSNLSGTNWRTFQTLELWGQWNIKRKIQILVIIPYSMNSIENKGLVIDSYNNLGDVQALARYQIFRTNSEESNYSHRMVLGIGLKTPTGKYKELSNLGFIDPHIQNGTGSWDFITNIGYLRKYKKWGINEEVIYKINTENTSQYQFANRFSSNTAIFFQIDKKDISLMPSVSHLFESAFMDKSQGIEVTNSNGNAHYVNVSLDIYYKKINLNFTLQKPFVENLRDEYLSNKFRLMTGIGYSF